MFRASSIRDRSRRARRPAVAELLEARQLPSAAGIGHVLRRTPGYVARADHVAVASPSASRDATPADPSAGESVNVPISVVKIKTKVKSRIKIQSRIAIDVTVAGVTRPYLLDTGSTGMYAAKDGLDGTQYVPMKQQRFKQHYTSGIRFSGTVAKATVALGGASASDVYLGLIEKAKNIRGWKKNLKGGTTPPYQGNFYGTLGMSLVPGTAKKQGNLYSVIAQLPGNLNSGFIVQAVGRGGSGPTLTIGLNAENTQGFTTVRMPGADGAINALPYSYGNGASNNVLAWNDKGVSVAYRVGGNVRFNAPSIFDTGNATTTIYTGNIPPPMVRKGVLVKGTPFEATVAPGTTWKFNAGEKVNVNKVLVGKTRGTVNTGIGLFFKYDVMYDLKNGTIGFRPATAG